MTNTEVEGILSKFGLLQEIKFDGDAFSGAELLIGSNGRWLTVEQRHLLFLALHYAALQPRIEDQVGFNPAVIAVDGIAKLGTCDRRIQVARLFKELCDKVSACFVCVVRTFEEIEDTDYVLTIIAPDKLGPNLRQGDSNAVFGGIHGTRWNSPDKPSQQRYRDWHREIAKLYSEPSKA